MGFPVKDWNDSPDTTTPVSAAALEDIEARVTAYADGVGAGGIELGYAEITANFTQTGIGNDDVDGLSVTVTVGVRPIVIKLNAANVANTSASGVTYLKIMEGSILLANQLVSLSTVGQVVARSVRLQPSAGSHTYKVNLQQVITGNSSVFADSSTSYGPASIQILEV